MVPSVKGSGVLSWKPAKGEGNAGIGQERRLYRGHNLTGAQRHIVPGKSIMPLSDREKAFEAKFQKDQELQFKVNARRNKLLGLWAAEKMEMSGGDAEAYAKEVVAADFDEPGEDDVVRKVLADLEGKGLEILLT